MLLLLLAFACSSDTSLSPKVDRDEDGYPSTLDCDDTDPNALTTETPDLCDGYDNNCDGAVDEDTEYTFYADTDRDGFGAATAPQAACTVPDGFVADATDCDDSTASIHPGADETCDERDDDCDGVVDENTIDPLTFYRDVDGDTQGDAAAPVEACSLPDGCVDNADDCDDRDADVFLGAQEVCDEVDDDCDGLVDDEDPDNDRATGTVWYADGDGDTYGSDAYPLTACDQPAGYGARADDCDDDDAAVHPGATERCNLRDDDCDGQVDEAGSTGEGMWYADTDRDGFGDAAATTTACAAPSGYIADATDCDDTYAAVNPLGTETCDGVDNDCNGTVDDDYATDARTWAYDYDDDDYGDPTITTLACSAPAHYVADSSDCNDASNAAHPGATELCNLLDDDCDGTVDEADAADATDWYADADSDGYGTSDTVAHQCSAPGGYASNNADCDDRVRAINPAALELCDLVDNNCDGADDEAGSVGESSWYADTDGDGFGDAAATATACAAPSGYITDATDCDDHDAGVNPDMVWYADADADGYGDPDARVTSCLQPTGYVADAADCADDDDTAHPGATETCNRVDDNCDGNADEGTADCPQPVAFHGTDLYGFDLWAGTSTAPLSAAASGNAMAVRADGRLYVGSTKLYQLNGCTGSVTTVGTMSASTCGLAFDDTDTLYGVSTTDKLYTINASTGAPTEVGPITEDGVTLDVENCDLAYDAFTDSLYALMINPSTSKAEIYSIDRDTGDATWVTTLSSSGAWSGAGGAVDPVTGAFYAWDRSDIYEVDVSTGARSYVLSAPATFNNMAFYDTAACP